MAHQSFAKKLLETLTAAVEKSGEVDTTELSHLLHIQKHKDHRRMLDTLCDLVKSGRIDRIRHGVYGLPKNLPEPEKREVMWRVLKMRRSVTIADLEELAGVSHEYACEWLRLLVKRGIAMRVSPSNKNHPHSWRLIKTDQVEAPVDTDKAEKLRNLREKRKKEALKALDDIDTASARARKAINELEE